LFRDIEIHTQNKCEIVWRHALLNRVYNYFEKNIDYQSLTLINVWNLLILFGPTIFKIRWNEFTKWINNQLGYE
jgi:hypothetical protein